MSTIRQAALAGAFYPADPAVLQQLVQNCLASVPVNQDQQVPKALIVPHAGYVYSGEVAAAGYASLLPAASRIKRVVLLGPCHRVAVRGLALSSANYFSSPLGLVKVDQQACQQLAGLPQVSYFDPTHAQEHSLEVQLPFLQSVLDDFQLVPLVVGGASVKQVAEVLDAIWGGEETLIVISSDLSHYLTWTQARAHDQNTARVIEALVDDTLVSQDACGSFAINGLLAAARKRHLQVKNLGMKNSGDTAGPKDRVVGYGAWAFLPPALAGASVAQENEETAIEPGWWPYRQALLSLARQAIEAGLQKTNPDNVVIRGLPVALQEPGAVFVTLNKAGQLRGCIGSLSATRALAVDVYHHAGNAAFRDPRFPPVTRQELDQLEISLAVLSEPRAMQFRDQQDLLSQLRPGLDGLIIASGSRRAVFLPAVWEQLPQPEQFLTQLKLKAGLAADYWADDFSAQRFTTRKCSAKFTT